MAEGYDQDAVDKLAKQYLVASDRGGSGGLDDISFVIFARAGVRVLGAALVCVRPRTEMQTRLVEVRLSPCALG